MANLVEKVYECNLAVEAHMVCDLLAQAGIASRVDGEFLQGAAGEIPLGNTVKVRVDPAHAAEAREVIAEWEAQAPPDAAAPPPATSARAHALLWFLAGGLVGGALVFLVFYGARTGNSPSDRNRDGRADAHWSYDALGAAYRYAEDNDFDGRFEWQYDVENKLITRGVLDADFDGRPEQVWHYAGNLPVRAEYYQADGSRVVKRQLFKAGRPDSAEYDDDGDGRFERRVRLDARGDPAM